ncbi:MAG: hypothetical protein RLP44_13700 [Aggregatilineales bacterium]
MTNISDIQIPHEDLPLWMRRARENVDWGIVIIGIISALVAWSFVLQPGLPLTNQSENYVYMTENYAEAIQEGRLYPRWNPYANYGYGAPVPHYTPPAAPYSAALIELLFTANGINAVRILFVLSLCGAGMMTYVFVLREAGARVAMIAAVAYVYSPYVGIIAPHIEGNLSAVMASAFLPALLWSVNRLLRINSAFDLIFVIFFGTLLILTNIQWAIASILLAILFATYQLISGKTTFKRWIHLNLIIGLSLFLSSFFWLPAVLEHDLVQWQTNRLFPQFFTLNWQTLFSSLPRIDLNELVPSPHYTLGLPIIILIIVSLFAIIRIELIRLRKLSFSGFFFLVGTLLIIFTITTMPDETGMLGIISFCFAVSAGALRHIYEGIPVYYRRLFAPLCLVTILTLSAPVWLSPRLTTTISDTSPTAQINHEISGFGIAAAPRYADFPITTTSSIQLSQALLNGYVSGEVSRISLDQRSLGREFDLIQAESHQDRYQICINQAVTLDMLRAYFDGWKVTMQIAPVQTPRSCNNPIDQSSNRIATLSPQEESGLIAIDIPSSNQQRIMTISLDDTDVRRAAWIISWATVTMLSVSLLFRLRRGESTTYIYFPMPDSSEARLLFVIVVAFATAIVTLTSPTSPLTLYATPGYSLNNTIAAPNNRTNEGIQLISYRLNQTTFVPGESLELFLAWRKNLNDPLRENFRVQVHIRDPQQNIRWSESLYQQPGGFPTRRWIRGFFVSDRHQLTLDNLIPGEYEVVIEIYVCEPECVDSRRVTFFDENQQIGQEFVLPLRIQVN